MAPGPVETALCLPCDLHGKRNRKEQVNQPYPAGILGLGSTDNIRLPDQQNPYSLIQFPKGCWSHKRSTTIARAIHTHRLLQFSFCSFQLLLTGASAKHAHAGSHQMPSWPTPHPPHTLDNGVFSKALMGRPEHICY